MPKKMIRIPASVTSIGKYAFFYNFNFLLKEIIINKDATADAIEELNVNLKDMTDSTKESIEKITTDFQNTIKKMFEKDTTPTETETETDYKRF